MLNINTIMNTSNSFDASTDLIDIEERTPVSTTNIGTDRIQETYRITLAPQNNDGYLKILIEKIDTNEELISFALGVNGFNQLGAFTTSNVNHDEKDYIFSISNNLLSSIIGGRLVELKIERDRPPEPEPEIEISIPSGTETNISEIESKRMYCSTDDVIQSIYYRVENIDFLYNPNPKNAISNAIKFATDKVDYLYKTKFGKTIHMGIVESYDNMTTIVLTESKNVNLKNTILYVMSGTGKGQYARVFKKDDKTITLIDPLETPLDATSVVKFSLLGYDEMEIDASEKMEIFTDMFPLLYVKSLTIDGRIIPKEDYVIYENEGFIKLKKKLTYNTETENYKNLRIEYFYGVKNMPLLIERLTAIIASIQILAAQIGGTYDDYIRVNMPGGLEGDRGEPFTNLRACIIELRREYNFILEKMYSPFVIVR